MAQHNIGHFEKIRALACGARVLVVGGTREGAASQVTFYDAVSHKRVSAATVPAHVLALTLAGDTAVAACSDGKLRLFKAGTGEATSEFEAHAGAVTGVAALPDGARVVTCGVDGALRVFSLKGERIASHELSSRPLRAVAADPTGELVAAAGDDGAVVAVTLATGARRVMPGHDGPVLSLAFTPRDGRLVSGGDDGLIRIWFLVGDVESEVRGNDESGHKAGVQALLFLPQPKLKAGAEDPGDRFASAGGDGTIKFWKLDDRRKPRSLEVQKGGVAAALAFLRQTKGEQFGLLFVGGEERGVDVISVDAAGTPGDTHRYGHGFKPLADALSSGPRPAREAAVRELAALDEPEALDLVLGALKQNQDEVRELAARELGRHGRQKARVALREALNAGNAIVFSAAYAALKQLEGSDSIGPARAALGSKFSALRLEALFDLAKLHQRSPLVAGLLLRALSDKDAVVRLGALEAYTSIFEPGAIEPLLATFERGTPDLRTEALVRAALAGQLSHPKLDPIVSSALDDQDRTTRRTAFALRVLEHPALAVRLEARDDEFKRLVREVSRQAAITLSGFAARREGKAPGDDAVDQARQKLGAQGTTQGDLGEADLGPLLAAMACRTPDTALRGARGLAELGDTRALGALLQLSREGDKQIRREATVALRALDDPRAKKRLVWMLDDTDADVRAAALEAYERLERDPLELTEAALRSSQKDIRVRGLNLLVKQGDRRSETTDTLLGDALEDESSDVRGEAFRTLWSWHTKDPDKALDRALQARFPDLRLRAVQELETLGKESTPARDRLLATVADRDEAVATAAFESSVKLRGKDRSEAPLAAMASVHGKLRAAGAKAARQAPVEEVRGALMKQLHDEHPEARSEALAALDRLLPREAGPLYAALQGSHYDSKVQAAELLAERHDEQIIEPMRALLGDKELAEHLPQSLRPALAQLRFRAAKALATLASPRLLKYLSSELLKDADGMVREQAARGLSLASRKGDEGFLLDALGHTDVAVRSWAAEGLARLGDVRALPVLTGHLRHANPPVRVGATLAFAALGPEGYGGMLQGLEDSASEVQDLVFLIILARDLRAFRRNEPPELLASALSSQRPEIRYAAGRALELRSDPERYLHHLIEAILPPRPDKASAMKDWPDEATRARQVVALAEGIASDQPEVRYTSAQTLRLRDRPLEFFRQAERIAKQRSQAAVADTTPRQEPGTEPWGAKGWLRRLFREGDGAAANDQLPDAEQQRLRWLAFGAYVGLLRQVGDDEEGARVRRDSIERVVELTQQNYVSTTAALPPLGRALDDPNYLVRRAAFAGLKRLFPAGADEPLVMALASHADDVARAALDELAGRGEAGRKAIVRALNSPVAEVRKHAFERLEGLYPRGSLEPLFYALESDQSDLRLGVLQRLASTRDDRVQGALLRALRSDHEDLRLQAAEMLTRRKSDAAVEVLSGFLRVDEGNLVQRATSALSQLGTGAAVEALASRLAEHPDEAQRTALIGALAATRNPAAIDAISQRFSDESESVRSTALDEALALTRIDSERRDHALALRALRAASLARDPELRRRAATELAEGEEVGQSAVLQGMLHDRDVATRKNAAASYAQRVRKHKAAVAPLEDMLARGARETLLSAAEGVAFTGGQAALRPLLLISRAGEGEERPRALLALGELGDPRALAEIEAIAAGGTEEAPVEPDMRVAAIEALGRMHARLTVADDRQRIAERLEQGVLDANQDLQKAAVRGLRWLDDRGRARLESVLGDRSTPWAVKVEAAEQLGAIKSTESESVLMKALNDSDSDVQQAAYTALRKILPTERTRIELQALGTDNSDLTSRAASYLAREGDAEVLLPRLATLQDADSAEQIRLGLLRRPTLPVAALVRLLTHADHTTRASAAWLLASRSGELSATEREAASRALVESEKLTAAAWAQKNPDERDAEETSWRTTVWALRLLGQAEMLTRLRALVVAEPRTSPASARHEAALALAERGAGDEDIRALQAALHDPEPGVRAAAASGLRRLAPERALKMALEVQPHDPVSFASAVSAPSDEALATEAGRRLVLPVVIREHAGSLLLPRLATAKGHELLELIAAAGRSRTPAVIEPLRVIAFDKKKYEVAERKAAYQAMRRVQRQTTKAKQETTA